MKLNKARRFVAILLGALLLFSPLAFSDTSASLYRIQTLVADTSSATRAEAANQVLSELLVRVSGTRQVLERLPPDDFLEEPELYAEEERFDLWQELTRAQRWVSQYTYGASDQLMDVEGTEVRAHRLTLEFDPDAITDLLQRMQAPVWDSRRPRTLFLIALQGRQGRYLVTPETNADLADYLEQQMALRGVPLKLPNEEVNPLPSGLLSDIWGGFNREVLEASQIYRPDAVVIGRIHPASGHWAVNWQLFTGLDRVTRDLQTTALREALDQGVHFVAEALAERYASSPDQGAGDYQLAVSNIRDAAAFASLMDYLQGLSLTQKVQVLRVQDQQLLLGVSLRGGMNQLRANLRLDGRLEETSFFSLQQAQDTGLRLHDQSAPDTSASASLFRQVDAWFKWQAD
ncbi:DUF2066 domain-containing protein [Marinospirillum sp.]|uniref:DUF2066 domain-containing protein n=1 Tax=Marinospirillum sp. TaxID=2183934 RepID=UPI003A8522FA